MLDIKQQKDEALEEDNGVVVHLHEINGNLAYYDKEGYEEQQPVTITVAGAYSSVYRRTEERQRRKKLKPKAMNFGTFHDEAMERVVACTLAWEGLLFEGNPFPLTKQNAFLLYEGCPWIYDDVVEAMHEHEDFFAARSGKQ